MTATHTTAPHSIQLHPCAKVNLGLNVVCRRTDGYHDIETVFYPIPLTDTLTVETLSPAESASPTCRLETRGFPINGREEDNLVLRAYHLLAQHYPLPPVRVTLDKNIPMQAGLGGGSSDAASMLLAINSLAQLHLDKDRLRSYAATLGADCAFFIDSKPTFATGIGEILSPIDLSLEGWHMLLVRPDDAVSTREAYAAIKPMKPEHCCSDVVMQPVEQWQQRLTNDFEKTVLPLHPAIAEVRARLVNMKPAYVQMSGSGSTVFALSKERLNITEEMFKGCWMTSLTL